MSEAEDVASFLLSTDANTTFAISKLDFSIGPFRIDADGYREMGHGRKAER